MKNWSRWAERSRDRVGLMGYGRELLYANLYILYFIPESFILANLSRFCSLQPKLPTETQNMLGANFIKMASKQYSLYLIASYSDSLHGL